MRRILSLLFGCQHRHISWPQGQQPSVTVQCLDCMERLSYDWEQMKILQKSRKEIGGTIQAREVL